MDEDVFIPVKRTSSSCKIKVLSLVVHSSSSPNTKFATCGNFFPPPSQVDDAGKTRLDLLVRPQLPALDARSHWTGLSERDLYSEQNVEPKEARRQLSELLGEDQHILVGHCLHNDVLALRLCFGINLVDVALLYGVENRSNSVHPIKTLAEAVLGEEAVKNVGSNGVGWDEGYVDPVERCKLLLKLAEAEAMREGAEDPLMVPSKQHPGILKVGGPFFGRESSS